jgi:hypothetical protein
MSLAPTTISGDSVVQEASTSLLLLLHVAAIYRPYEVEDDAHPLHVYFGAS